MTNAISSAVPTDIRRDRIRQLAARANPKNPARPPWAWTNLVADEAAWLDDALDEFVETYNRIHASSVDEVIPACWRLHPPAAQELPVQFWAWWNAHIDPTATIAVAVDYYQRVLPGFQARLATRLLGKSAVNCRKGRHALAVDRDLIDAISFEPTGPAEATGRSSETRRVLREMDFGTTEGR